MLHILLHLWSEFIIRAKEQEMYRSNLYNFIEGGNLNWILYQVEKILLE